MLALYRRLLAARRSPSLRRGDYRPLHAPQGCLIYMRSAPGSAAVVVALNMAERTAVVEVPQGRVIVATDPEREGTSVSGPTELAGNEGLVIELS